MEQLEYSVNEPRDKRKLALVALSVLLVVALIGGGTFAYLTATTTPVSNVFTSPYATITASLIEPKWTATGAEAAKNMYPTVVVDKDPQIQNTNPAGGEGEYIAMKLTFQKATEVEGDTVKTWANMSDDEVKDLFIGVAVSENNKLAKPGMDISAKWTTSDPLGAKAISSYYYADSLDAQAISESLFNNVGIIPTAGNAAWTTGAPTIDNFMSWLNATCKDGKFQIVAEGAAVQKTGFADAAAAQATLKGLLNL